MPLRTDRRSDRRIAALLLGILAGMSAPSYAEQTYYRWIDDGGHLVMSDRPPESDDIEYEIIGVEGSALRRPRMNTVPETPVAATPAPSVGAGQGDGEPQEAAPTVIAFERDPEACEQARNNLEVLNMKPRIRVYNAQGELEYLTPEQIEEEKRKSRLTMEVHCER